MGKSMQCAGCDASLTDYRGRGIQVICYSGIFGAANIPLCKKCSDHEEEEIDKMGTNDIPNLLKRYKENN